MNKKITSFIAVLLFASVPCVAGITENAGTAAFAFLKIGQGARATAMADAYAGLSDDINALYWNPAGIAQLKSSELIVSDTIWFESINRSYIGYVHSPYKFGTMGLSVNYVSVPYEKRTIDTDDSFDSASATDLAASVSWGRKFSDKLLLGCGLKYISESLDEDRKLNAFALDLGGLYKLSDTLQTGVSLQNMGSDPLPGLLRAGVSKRSDQDKLILSGDIAWGLVDGTSSVSIGTEYKWSDLFYPRLGYKYRINNSNFSFTSGFSAGFGLKYKRYGFDYAFVPYGDLGFTHNIDLLVKF